MGVIQMIINGIACLGGDAALPCGAGWYPPFTTDSIPVWTTNTGVFSDGLLPYTNDLAGCGKFKDYDTEWTATGAVWGFWADPSHLGLYFGDQFNIHSPYGPNDYSEFTGYVPYDTSGGIDGLVDDTYVTRMALDSAPVGLEDPYDIIFYYLESPPATPAIEVIQNIKSMPFPTPLATIKTFTGTPVDVTVYNAYGYIADAAGNWVVALEKNATSWQIAAFDQNGNLIARYPTPISGNPIEIDNDITNHKLHVWYDASGTLKYVIFIYA
jgi:hypothetical protein